MSEKLNLYTTFEHQVVVDYSVKDRFENSQDIEDWIEASCKGEYSVDYMYQTDNLLQDLYTFEFPEDAVAFRLMWG